MERIGQFGIATGGGREPKRGGGGGAEGLEGCEGGEDSVP